MVMMMMMMMMMIVFSTEIFGLDGGTKISIYSIFSQFSPKYLNGLSTVWSTAIYRNTGFFLLSNPAFAHSTLPPHASHM